MAAQRAAVADAHVAPTCPKCATPMQATAREPKLAPVAPSAHGSGQPRITLNVWRCAGCGIDRPRFD